MSIHFQCLGVMLPKKMTTTFPLYRIHRSKSKNRTGTGSTLFATNANFTRTYNEQSLAGANLDEMQTVDFLTAVLFGWEKSHLLCNNSVRKIVNDRLSKTLVRTLPYRTVGVDEPGPFVVS